MHCILHIGTEKTGSTAIQQFLHYNSGKFKRQGAHLCTSVGKPNNRSLPAAFMREDRNDDFLRRMNHKGIAGRRRWRRQLLKEFLNEVAQANKKSEVFIISSEHFHSRLQHLDEVRELFSFLEPLFSSISVICYLRRQDHLAMSRYSEAMRAGHVHQSPLPAGARRAKGPLPNYFDFESLLNRWADAFGEENIQPHIYSKDTLLNGDVIQDFVQAAGLQLPQDSALKVGNANIALSAEAQTVLLGVNRKFRELECTESELRLRGSLVRYLQLNAPGKSRQPSAAEARQFYALFEPSNNAVARRWFGRDSLFDVDFSQYPESVPVVSAENVAELLAGFMMQERQQPKS